MARIDTILIRRDTAANWSSVNPVLLLGELGEETDTRLRKTGDGSLAWNSLPYQNVRYANVLNVPANLAAIAGLNTAADMLTYWTGNGTAALTSLTPFARSFLDDADGPTVRTTIGAGTVSSFAFTNGAGITGSVANSSSAPTLSLTLGAITPSSVAATGLVTGSNLSGTNTGDQTSVTGNAGTATKLATARNINGVAFDGTASITINATDSTARVPTTRLVSTTAPLTGGGDLSADRTLAITAATQTAAGSMSGSDKAKLDGIASGATANTGTVTSFAFTNGAGIAGTVTNASTTPALSLTLGAITPSSVAAIGNVTGANLSGTNTGDQTNITGNAGTATKWQTARTLSFTGDATGTGSVDGSANVSTTLALSTTAVTAGSYNYASITVDAKGRITAASNGATPVTSVAGTAPIVSSGGATPSISINPATTTTPGSQSAADKASFDALYAGWQSQAVTATPSSGSFTSTATAYYLKFGKTVVLDIVIIITDNGSAPAAGSAGGVIYVTMPFPGVAGRNKSFIVREDAVVGFCGSAVVQVLSSLPSRMAIQRYDGGYPGGTNYRLLVHGVYETA